MEGAGAVGLLKRSIEKRKVTYIQFIEHRDSDSFKSIREEMENRCGSRCLVRKEECVGHG